MACRLINVHIHNKHVDDLKDICTSDAVIDTWKWVDGEESANIGFIVHAEDVEEITDKLQSTIGDRKGQSITVSTLDSVLPQALAKRTDEQQKKKRAHGDRISREELYGDVVAGSKLSWNFVFMVVLSTVVASIGLLEDDVAVVIGAMVIAPLLGPNIALALATALGDRDLMKRSLCANAAGVSLCLLLSFGIGLIWPAGFEAEELASRTTVSYDNIALAIAAGAAAALSLTTGVASALVGVMVAVALLPPASAVGIMIGAGDYGAANGALLLLVVNITCINLAAKLVFWAQRIRPRSWYEQKRAGEAMRNYLIFWIGTLVLLAVFIYLRKTELPVVGTGL